MECLNAVTQSSWALKFLPDLTSDLLNYLQTFANFIAQVATDEQLCHSWIMLKNLSGGDLNRGLLNDSSISQRWLYVYFCTSINRTKIFVWRFSKAGLYLNLRQSSERRAFCHLSNCLSEWIFKNHRNFYFLLFSL